MDHASNAHHGEAAILHLGQRVTLGGLGLLAETERIELEITGSTLALEGLEKGDGAENLEERDPQQELAHGALLYKNVVDACHLCTTNQSLVGRVDSYVLEHGASSGKHRNAPVLDLGFTEELDVRNASETEGVETHVSNHALAKSHVTLEERNRLGHRLHGGAMLGNGAASGGAAKGCRRREGGGSAGDGSNENRAEHGCCGRDELWRV
mmetsp:Transcript_12239/g.17755  ORF Transcript_12239/g.17755 Transcript_12239/m.17755 type:complete len:210 (-) Transcript_12239:20-649(-)